jgi:hypothetical protein
MRTCEKCGYSLSENALYCSYCGTYQSQKHKEKKSIYFYGTVLAIILGICFVGFFLLQYHAVNSISVEVTELSTSRSFFSFSAEIEVTIYNGGILPVTFTDSTITLFVNQINIQTMDFETEIIVINSMTGNSYTATMTTLDSEKASELKSAEEFHVVLQLVSEAKSTWYSSGINVRYDGTWS